VLLPGDWAYAQGLPKAFRTRLRASGFVFDVDRFQGFSRARVLPNPHMPYEFAMRHDRRPFEARYAIRTFGDQDEARFKAMALVTVFNMTVKSVEARNGINVTQYRAEDVRAEFNADFGLSAGFDPDPTFANHDIGLCHVIGREKGGAMGFSIYLFKAEEDIGLMQPIYHALRFAPAS
jgi:hypothetical protein